MNMYYLMCFILSFVSTFILTLFYVFGELTVGHPVMIPLFWIFTTWLFIHTVKRQRCVRTNDMEWDEEGGD